MPKAYETWTVHPHGPLVRLAEDVWCVDGSLPDMPLPRRFTVVRLRDGGLVLHNGIAVDERTMEEVLALGAPRYLVVPNGYHRLDAKVFARRFPDAVVVAPRNARPKVDQVVKVGLTYDEIPPDPRVRFAHLAGVSDVEGVLEVHGADGVTVVFNDAIFNLPTMKGFFGFVYGRLMGNAGRPRVTTLFRLAVVKDKRAFAADLRRIAALPGLARIVMSHGDVIDRDAAGVLQEVAASL